MTSVQEPSITSPPSEEREQRSCRGLPVALSAQQELACAFRVLAAHGCNTDIAGHITMIADRDFGTFWCNPFGMWWEEICASDIVLMGHDGSYIEGRWQGHPGVHIHTEVHRRGGDAARVAVHNHPHYGVLLGLLGVVPEIIEQQSCLLDGEIGIYDEYAGGVMTPEEGEAFATGVGLNSAVLLKNHGCLITADNLQHAVYKTVVFERLCRLTYETLSTGVQPALIPTDLRPAMKKMLVAASTTMFWDGAVRQLLKSNPEVLD